MSGFLIYFQVDYQSDNPTSGMISKLEDFDYTMKQSEEGYKNFTVIKCKIKSIEWLYLAAKGHRRAKFDPESNKNNWLVPQKKKEYLYKLVSLNITSIDNYILINLMHEKKS